MSQTLYECPFCGGLKPSENGTGSDVSCCGEVGASAAIGVTVENEPVWPVFDEALGG